MLAADRSMIVKPKNGEVFLGASQLQVPRVDRAIKIQTRRSDTTRADQNRDKAPSQLTWVGDQILEECMSGLRIGNVCYLDRTRIRLVTDAGRGSLLPGATEMQDFALDANTYASTMSRALCIAMELSLNLKSGGSALRQILVIRPHHAKRARQVRKARLS